MAFIRMTDEKKDMPTVVPGKDKTPDTEKTGDLTSDHYINIDTGVKIEKDGLLSDKDYREAGETPPN